MVVWFGVGGGGFHSFMWSHQLGIVLNFGFDNNRNLHPKPARKVVGNTKVIIMKPFPPNF